MLESGAELPVGSRFQGTGQEAHQMKFGVTGAGKIGGTLARKPARRGE